MLKKGRFYATKHPDASSFEERIQRDKNDDRKPRGIPRSTWRTDEQAYGFPERLERTRVEREQKEEQRSSMNSTKKSTATDKSNGLL